MGAYTTYDLAETLKIVRIDPKQVDKVLLAWGSSHDGTDEPGTEWKGGFLLSLKPPPDGPGRYAFVHGWNDYTGWGCQDGAAVGWFDEPPERAKLVELAEWGTYGPVPGVPAKGWADWDEEPADLNRWVQAGGPDPWSFE